MKDPNFFHITIQNSSDKKTLWPYDHKYVPLKFGSYWATLA